MTDLNLRAARLQLYGLLTAVLAAILIAIGITIGAFVLSFSVLKDLAVQSMLPAHHAWIFPAIVDGGIVGATVAVIVLSKIDGSAKGRNFFLCLLVAVVLVSVGGNAYHAHRAAQEAAEAAVAGVALGFSPLAPGVAAIIAVIPPLLVLAFTHGIGILIKAVGTAAGEYKELVQGTEATADATMEDVAHDVATSDAHGAPSVAGATMKPQSVASANPQSATDPSVMAEERWPDEAVVAPVAHDNMNDAHDVAGNVHIAHDVAGNVHSDALHETFASVVAPARATTANAESSQVPEQTTEALLAFIEQNPGFSAEVRETARLKILDPDLTFAAIAEQTGGVATSTALRRYNKAEDAALRAGFVMPPLPDLGEHALDRDFVGAQQLVTS